LVNSSLGDVAFSEQSLYAFRGSVFDKAVYKIKNYFDTNQRRFFIAKDLGKRSDDYVNLQ